MASLGCPSVNLNGAIHWARENMRIEFKRGVGAKGTHGREREQHEALRGGGEIFQHECHHPERASEVGNKMPEN